MHTQGNLTLYGQGRLGYSVHLSQIGMQLKMAGGVKFETRGQ